MTPTTGPYSTPGGTGATSDPVAPPHFLHTQEAIEEALREAGHGDLPDLNDVIFIAAEAARGALGVCLSCDGTGEYSVDPADSVGPEDCGFCGGSGWGRAALAAAATPAPPVDWPARFRAAADEAKREGFDALAAHLAEAAEYLRLPGRVDAIARALTGEAS